MSLGGTQAQENSYLVDSDSLLHLQEDGSFEYAQRIVRVSKGLQGIESFHA